MTNLCLSGRSPVDFWCVVVQIHVEDADDHKGEDCCHLVIMDMVIMVSDFGDVMVMVMVMVMVFVTHSMRNMQPRQRKQPKRETQGLKYLNAGRQPLRVLCGNVKIS